MRKIVYLLLIGLMFTVLGCGIEAPKVNPKNESNMSEAEFDQIKNGMTYDQVTAIIGGPGEIVSEIGTPGDQFYTVKYQFKGDGGMWDAHADLTFQSGKLNTKAQTGLKEIKN